MKQRIEIEWDDEEVRGWSLRKRGDDLDGLMPIWEAWVQLMPQRDSYGRGIGLIDAEAEGQGLTQAFVKAIEKARLASEDRLAERNAIPPGQEPQSRGIVAEGKIETTKSSDELGF